MSFSSINFLQSFRRTFARAISSTLVVVVLAAVSTGCVVVPIESSAKRQHDQHAHHTVINSQWENGGIATLRRGPFGRRGGPRGFPNPVKVIVGTLLIAALVIRISREGAADNDSNRVRLMHTN